MRKTRAHIGLLAITAALLVPAASHADEHNTCSATLTGPKLGRHSRTDMSAAAVLWPPNHKLHSVSVSASNAQSDSCNVTITDVRQDEAVDEPGSGNTDPDAAGCSNAGDTSTVQLRGERSGLGDGRYYHVMVEMDDPDSDEPKADDLKVLVPHDQGIKKVWSDGGGLFPSSSSVTTISCTS